MADRQVALAKLSRPRLHDVLPRTRLFEQLDRALQRPVAWLSAQPGAGKTTLVAGWLQAREKAHQGGGIWYQVDDGDADPASFIYHLRLAAAGATSDKSAAALPLLTPEYLADLRGFARRFFRALYQQLAPGNVLVLDNFQEVPHDGAFHRLMAEAIVQLPEGIHLIVISRTEPAGLYASLLAGDAIALLDGEALRLTLAETQAIAGRRGVERADDAQALHARSQGWAAGLTLLLTRTRGQPPGDDDDSESLQHVFSYFAQRVFDETPAAHQIALMQLAVLPQIAPGIAERLTDMADVARLLEHHYKRHLFTDRRRVATPATNPGDATSTTHVYQFHALFRSFLLHQGRQHFSADAWRELIVRAARLLAAAGYWENALALFAQAADWAAYMHTVLAHAERALDQGRQQSLSEWLARMPTAEREHEPWLAYWGGRASMHADTGSALRLLNTSHERFARDGDAAGQLAAGAAIVQTLWYARLGWSEITPWVERLESLMGQRLRFPSPALELFTHSALHAALAFCRLAHPEILGMGRRLLEGIDDAAIDWNQRLLTATHLMTWFHNAAELDLANRLIAKVDPVIDERPSSALNRSFWFTFRAIHDMRQGRSEEASRLYQRAEELARDNGLAHAEYAALQFHSYLDILFRRTDEARARLARMEVHPARGHADAEMNFHNAQALLAQLQGRTADALAHAQRTLDAIERVGAGYFKAVYTLSLISVFADAGQGNRALQLIDGVRAISRGTYLEPMEGQLLLEEAYVAWTQADRARLLDKLGQGLSLAASERKQAAYVHRIAARRPQLLVSALQAGIEVEFVRALIRRWRVAPPDEEIPLWPWPIRVRTLGSFEALVHEQPIAFGRKAPKKTLALLKALIARGGSATDSALIDLFWPDEEGDAAAKSLGAAVHRLRQLLTVTDAVVQLGGLVSLDRDRVWVDAWAFERGLASTPQVAADALSLYRGAFLVEVEGEHWPVATRERLRGKFVHAVADHASRLEAAQRHEEAIVWYLKGLDADSVVEPFYQGLMRCYHRLDRLPEAVSAYRRCKQILSVTLSLPPSAGTEKLYQALRLE